MGVTDLPIKKISEDNLRIITYIEGLSDFIRSCATPMTIALQGDWGTGKTSFMNLVIDQLQETNKSKGKVETIVFNTWKYSQFNQEQNLALSFLSYIVSKLHNKTIAEVFENNVDNVLGEKKDSTLVSLAKTIGRLAYSFSADVASQTLVSTMGGVLPNNSNSEISFNREEVKSEDLKYYQRLSYVDSAAAIEDLKAEFKRAIEDKIENSEYDRVVIFIDDLDRLDPVVAVNLLEVIKIFLDVPNCVFVLSVDYGVVTRGVKLKNGDQKMDDEKAHSFFDKMIQVPFRIPMEFYNFEKFLKENLPEISSFTELHKLIRHSIGNNPRGVKRLLNSYYLISKIMFRGEASGYNEKQRGQLIALLCMQLAHEPLYNYFCLGSNELKMLLISNEEEIVDLLNEINIPYNPTKLRKHYLFLKALRSYIFGVKTVEEINENNDDDREALELFITTLSYANITSEKATEEIDEIIQVPLSEINNYSPMYYLVDSINCKTIDLKVKSATGIAFEMFEEIIKPNEAYKLKMQDYKQLPQMKAAGIEKRLILPFLEQLSKQSEASKWIEENIPDYQFKEGEYSDTLTNRIVPGLNYAIITNYSALGAVQYLYKILNFLEDEHIDQTTVILKKKKS